MDEPLTNTSVATAADTLIELHRYLADSSAIKTLHGILRSYVRNAHLVPPTEVDDEASELLQNTVRRAIEIADKYHGTGIAPWLLSIAANLLRQKRRSEAQHREKVIPLRDLHQQEYPTLSEEEFFELFTTQIAASNEQESRLLQDLKEAIAHLSADDQLLLNYYINYGYNHNEIAHRLGIKPGAARVRYHRAVNQLRKSLMAYHENGEGETDA